MIIRPLYVLWLAVFGIFLLSASPEASAVVYTNPITVNGVVSDWTSPNNIPGNSDQASTDALGSAASCPGSTDDDAYDNNEADTGTCVGLSGGVGRDLKTFAFTYDGTNLYLYVERFASSTNVTDWWFYLDTDNNGRMNGTDIVYRVKWQGSNQNTDREYWRYSPAATIGDPLIGGPDNNGDGYSMPGTINTQVSLGSITGGTASGTQMETFLPWSIICGAPGCGPKSIGFHISSSNGSNLPNNIIDNMNGPTSAGGGSGLVFLDLGITKSVDKTSVGRVNSVAGAPTVTFSVTVTNNGGGNATDVEVRDVLPAAFEFVSADQTVTTTFNGGTGETTVDWTIASLPDGSSTTLNIDARPIGTGAVDTASESASNSATIIDLNEADTNSSNNVSNSVSVTITEPDLRITKSHPGDFVLSTVASYSLVASNQSGAGAHVGQIKIIDTLPTELSFQGYSGTNWVCTEPATGTVECTTGNSSSVLASGAALPALTLNVNVDGPVGTVLNEAEVEPAATMAEYATATAFDGNNDVQDSTVIVATPASTVDIALSKSVDNAAPIAAVDEITFTITATNNGPDAASGVIVDDPLPAGLTLNSFSLGPAGGQSYNSGSGAWNIGALPSGNSKTLTLKATADAGTGGDTITNNAILSAVNEYDSGSSNNTASVSVIPIEANLSTSSKSVVDDNGGEVTPGDKLIYTITIVETGGAAVTGVSVFDDVPTNTSNLSNVVVTGSTTTPNIVSGGPSTIDIEDIGVSANGTVTVEFSVVVQASALDFDTVSNSAEIDYIGDTVVVSAPTLTVRRGQNKVLYFHNVAAAADDFAPPSHGAFSGVSGRSLSRIPTTDTAAVTVTGNSSRIWLMDPAFFNANTIDDKPGSAIPVQLVMERPNNGSKSATVNFYSDSNCDGAGGSLLASSGTENVLAATSSVETFSVDLSSNVALAAGECVYLEVLNNTSGKDFSVLPYSTAESKYSRVDIPVFVVINVDSLDLYDESDAGFTTPLTSLVAGETVVMRAVVSDPFGEFDITSALLTILDADLNKPVDGVELVTTYEVADGDPATRTFEYTYSIPSTPVGTWKFSVESIEGREAVPITSTGESNYTVNPAPPELQVEKKVYENTGATEIANVSSGETVIYEIVVTNIGQGDATGVEVNDTLGRFTDFAIDPWSNSTPFEFTDLKAGDGISALGNWQYSINGGTTFLAPPLDDDRNGAPVDGFDSDVTDFRIIFDSADTLDAADSSGNNGGAFRIRYKTKIN